ncbi:MAG: hypothetical protein EOP56_18155 [Sphingobacteriales bacterium]|nr:MAG: hypothetical protein EOP56_18155 [Sphingobacteriales bacterium]
MDRLFKQDQEIFSFGIDEVGKAHLLETARWSKFLAILFIIVSAIMVLFGVFAAFMIGNLGGDGNELIAGLGGVGFAIFYFLFLGIYMYPVWALYKFSKLTRLAVNTSNQQVFNDALRYQRNMYKYIGILTIIVISLYGISFVLMAIAAAVSRV